MCWVRVVCAYWRIIRPAHRHDEAVELLQSPDMTLPVRTAPLNLNPIGTLPHGDKHCSVNGCGHVSSSTDLKAASVTHKWV